MAIIWDDVVNLDASLSAVPAATQAAILLDVRLQVSADAMEDRYDLACKYLAAHLGVVAERQRIGGVNGPSGPVASESLDGASRSYATGTTGGGATDTTRISLDSTPWGREYQRILDLHTVTGLPFVI